MMGFVRDVRFGLRMLAKSPTFTAVAVLTLGLGIGAMTAIFSVIDAVVLRPLPFPAPEQLVQLYTQFPTMHFDKFWLSPPEYNDLSRDARSYQSVAAYEIGGAAVIAKDRPVRTPMALATHTLARTLGVAPALGRWFGPADDLPNTGDPRVAVVSHRMWQGAFAGDPEIVGRHITVDAAPVTVIGVMPASFAFPNADTDMWLPERIDPASIARGSHGLTVIGRLAPGVGLEQARAELGSLMAGWKSGPASHVLAPPFHPIIVLSLKDEIIGSVRTTLWL